MNTKIIDSVEHTKFASNEGVTANEVIGTKTKNNKIVSCLYCREEMEVQEKIIIFDSNWFHDYCWEKFSGENLEKNPNKINI